MSWSEQLYNWVSIYKLILFFCLPNRTLNFWGLQTTVFSSVIWGPFWYEVNSLFLDTLHQFLGKGYEPKKSVEYALKILP